MGIIIDKTGRKLKVGMIVDVPVSNMMTCIVTEVQDTELVLPGGQSLHPRVIVQPLPMQMEVGRNQEGNLVSPNVYILRDAPQEKKSHGVGGADGVQDRKPGAGEKSGLTLVS